MRGALPILGAAAALLGLGGPWIGSAAGDAGVPGAPTLAGRLGLDDAVRMLRESSLDLVAADAALADAGARVEAAGALPNPILTFGVGTSWQCSGGGCEHPLYAVSLSDQSALSMLATGQRRLALDVARGGFRAAQAARDDALRNALFSLKRQMVAVSMADRVQLLALQEAAAARDAVARARQAVAAGSLKEADVSRLEVVQLQIEQGEDAADRSLRQAKAALAQLLGARGTPADFQVDLEPLHAARWPQALAGATLAMLHERAIRQRPDLGAARLQLEQARAQVALARRQAIPPLSLQVGYTMQGTHHDWFTPPTGSVALSVPLPVLYRQEGQVAQAEAAALAADVALARAEGQVTSDVVSAWAALTAARSAARRAEDRLLPRARTAEQQVREELGRGGATLGELLDSQRARIAAELEVIQSVGAYWIALFQLEQALGTALIPQPAAPLHP